MVSPIRKTQALFKPYTPQNKMAQPNHKQPMAQPDPQATNGTTDGTIILQTTTSTNKLT